jgi:hypothetical protein
MIGRAHDEDEDFVDDEVSAHAKISVPKTARGVSAKPFMASWKLMREQLFMEQRVPYTKLPKYVEKYLRLLFDTTEGAALRAMKIGDVPFFIGWMFRLDAIDVAMIDGGFQLADRAALIRFRAAVDGYREVAEKRLRKLGGRWPPVAKNER